MRFFESVKLKIRFKNLLWAALCLALSSCFALFLITFAGRDMQIGIRGTGIVLPEFVTTGIGYNLDHLSI